MKRKNGLYREIYQVENILAVFHEVCKNTKNKRKVRRYKEYKCSNVFRIHNMLKNKCYEPEKPHTFTIYEPKERLIESQCMQDKIINHLVSRYILYPALLPCMVESSVASRKGKGTKAGREYFKEYSRLCKIKYGKYYILKCDIQKFFHSINREKLKAKVKKRIKDKDALEIIFKILDTEEQGLGIGKMTSQVLAVFYLNDFDHFVKEKLKIKYYIRYQDDFVLFHPSKEYLKICLEKIKQFLEKEDLTLNKKTRIYRNTNNFIFLGRNQKGKYCKYRSVKRKIKKRMHLYQIGKIKLSGMLNALNNYKYLMTH